MGNLRHPVSSLQPRCRIPVRFPSPQTNFSPYIPLSAAFAGAGSGHLPAQLPVGPRPPAGPDEPRVAGTGMAGQSRRRAVPHRPRFHRLRDLRRGQGRSCHHGYTGARGYHPLLAVAAGAGDVLMVRLREGRTRCARPSSLSPSGWSWLAAKTPARNLAGKPCSERCISAVKPT